MTLKTIAPESHFSTILRMDISTNLSDLKRKIVECRNQFSMSYLDRDVLPYLCELHSTIDKNIKPDIIFVESLQELPVKIQQAKMEHTLFISNFSRLSTHFCVFDMRIIDNKKSVIMFETTTLKKKPETKYPHAINRKGYLFTPRSYYLTVRDGMKSVITSGISFEAVSLDIQKSPNNCGMMCLCIAKYLRENNFDQKIVNIHQNIVSVDGFVELECLDTYIPKEIMKYSESSTRIEAFSRNNNLDEKTATELLDFYMSHKVGCTHSRYMDIIRSEEYEAILRLN